MKSPRHGWRTPRAPMRTQQLHRFSSCNPPEIFSHALGPRSCRVGSVETGWGLKCDWPPERSCFVLASRLASPHDRCHAAHAREARRHRLGHRLRAAIRRSQAHASRRRDHGSHRRRTTRGVLERAGFVVMKRPPMAGGAAIGFGARDPKATRYPGLRDHKRVILPAGPPDSHIRQRPSEVCA